MEPNLQNEKFTAPVQPAKGDFSSHGEGHVAAPTPYSVADGTVPNSSEQDGTIPHDAERDGIVPNNAERLGTVPRSAAPPSYPATEPEKTDSHTLTVRKVLRMFEDAGVTRSERCITKWCKPNRDGVAKLNCFLDEEARRYFITPESVRIAIKEEQEKGKEAAPVRNHSEQNPDTATSRNDAEENASNDHTGEHPKTLKRLRSQIRDLQITNAAKDMHIESVEKDRERMFDELIGATKQIGHLNEQLLQLGSGTGDTNFRSSQNGSARMGIADEIDDEAA